MALRLSLLSSRPAKKHLQVLDVELPLCCGEGEFNRWKFPILRGPKIDCKILGLLLRRPSAKTLGPKLRYSKSGPPIYGNSRVFISWRTFFCLWVLPCVLLSASLWSSKLLLYRALIIKDITVPDAICIERDLDTDIDICMQVRCRIPHIILKMVLAYIVSTRLSSGLLAIAQPVRHVLRLVQQLWWTESFQPANYQNQRLWYILV